MKIVGVAPRGFEGTTLGSRPLVFVPITMRGACTGFRGYDNRQSYWVYLFGRLKPGVSLAQAGTALNAVYRPIINDVEAPLQTGMSEPTMARFKAKEIGVPAGEAGPELGAPRSAHTALYAVRGHRRRAAHRLRQHRQPAAGARGQPRARRWACGWRSAQARRQLLLQLLTESVLLALLGGIASLLVARWTLDGIAALLPPEALNTLAFTLQPSVLAFAALLSSRPASCSGCSPRCTAPGPT